MDTGIFRHRQTAKEAAQVAAHAEALSAEFGEGHELAMPKVWHAPVVFASPHSGQHYPDGLRKASTLSLAQLRRNEDAFVDTLFGCAPQLGAPLLKATFPRCFVDVNRPGDDLPPEWLQPGQSRMGPSGSYRARLGLGVVPLIISESLPIHRQPPTRAEATARLDTLYWPYHAKLGKLLQMAKSQFGEALLVDCHSMPGFAAERAGRKSETKRRPDIILGDGHGRTAHARTVDHLEALFSRRGYHVTRNYPYAGGYATLNYGQPATGVEAVQIEINRDLYLDAATLAPTAGYDELARDVGEIVADLIAARAPGLSEAAE